MLTKNNLQYKKISCKYQLQFKPYDIQCIIVNSINKIVSNVFHLHKYFHELMALIKSDKYPKGVDPRIALFSGHLPLRLLMLRVIINRRRPLDQFVPIQLVVSSSLTNIYCNLQQVTVVDQIKPDTRNFVQVLAVTS